MKKIVLLTIIFITTAKAYAQTSPTPFDLFGAPYTFTFWDSAAPALTYPANMMFHTLGNQNPDENTPANGDWACAYNLTVGCWINGLDTQGVSFRNIGNSQSPSCAVNATSTSLYAGDASVALNTNNCENIAISWIGRMHSNFTYSDSGQISRFYGIACQYRIGTSGSYTNLPGNYLFVCNSDSVTYKLEGTADTLTALLPDTCNNQAIVEVRWVYHQTEQNSGGPRPVIGFDDINITRDIVTALPKQNEKNKSLSIFPNPIHQGKINLNKTANFMVVDLLGQVVIKPSYAKEVNIDHLPNGVYFVKSAEGEIIKFIKQ
jgi:hypothetical protein